MNSSLTGPYAVSFLLSFGHLNGTGPIPGLGGDAIANWLSVGQIPGAALDAQGSFRLDFNFGTPVGIDADLIFLLQDPAAGGAVVSLSHILEWDP